MFAVAGTLAPRKTSVPNFHPVSLYLMYYPRFIPCSSYIHFASQISWKRLVGNQVWGPQGQATLRIRSPCVAVSRFYACTVLLSPTCPSVIFDRRRSVPYEELVVDPGALYSSRNSGFYCSFFLMYVYTSVLDSALSESFFSNLILYLCCELLLCFRELFHDTQSWRRLQFLLMCLYLVLVNSHTPFLDQTVRASLFFFSCSNSANTL